MHRATKTTGVVTGLLTIAIAGPLWSQQAITPANDQIVSAEQALTESVLRAHIRFLADDLLEGRGPGSRGDELAQRYIAAQFESLGLKPAAPGGGWFQRVPLVDRKSTR